MDMIKDGKYDPWIYWCIYFIIPFSPRFCQKSVTKAERSSAPRLVCRRRLEVRAVIVVGRVEAAAAATAAAVARSVTENKFQKLKLKLINSTELKVFLKSLNSTRFNLEL